MRRFSAALTIAAAALVITLLGFHHVAFSGLIFGKGDAFHYFTPLWAARDAALRSLDLPLWTDQLFMGVPLLADSQLGTFYPPNWLTVWLPAWDALKVSVLIHVAWAAAGALILARRSLGLAVVPALIAAVVYALGGYVGAHAEQINQLQGIAWMPWAAACFLPPASGGQTRSGRIVSLMALAAVLALIAFSGHTQTLFITGVMLGVLALVPYEGRDVRRVAKGVGLRLAGLAAASVIALALAAVQILPTLELTGLSNRSGGFSALAAMAFSWNPNLAARGLLPSLDGQVFGEYVAYLGVFGLGLAVWGALYGRRARWPWLILALAGVVLALGLYTPVYWVLAELPGFNLFRVPARWLAFVALGGAMLAGLGADALLKRSAVKPNRGLLIAAGLTGLLAVLAVWRAPAAAAEVDGSASPTVPTVLFWAATGLMFANVVLLSRQSARRGLLTVLLVGITAGELAIAAANMPHADLVDPAAAADPRLTAHQIEVDGGGRLLSISAGYFDTYDRAALLAYYTSIGMTERAAKAGLTAAKLKELQAPNFPLLYGLSTADGFGGGLAPTVYYSAFSALLLPEGQPRTQDGRLRELLALPECLGACVPETRWLDLMGVKYLILDKTADRFYDDVQFDVSLPVTLSGQAPTAPAPVDPPFAADELHVLLVGDPARLTVSLDGQPPVGMTLLDARAVNDGLTLARFSAPLTQVERLALTAGSGDVTVRAATLVDTRSGAFDMVTLGGWDKLLSSDIKLYRRQSGTAEQPFLARVHTVLPDSWDGSEAAIDAMRDPAFDPLTAAIIHGAPDDLAAPAVTLPESSRVVSYTRAGTRSETTVVNTASVPLALVLNTAYFPGWTATLDGAEAPLYRADILFQAVIVPPGEHTIVVEYAPPWVRPLLAFAALAWGAWLLALLATLRLSRA